MNWCHKNVKKLTTLFFIGDWQVTPSTNSLRCGNNIKQLEPKAMDVLLLLCQQVDVVLSIEEIANQCWGNTNIGDNPVHKAINQLRKAFDDKPSAPKYIETIRKRGYRIIAQLNFPLDDDSKAVQSDWQGNSPFPGLRAFEPGDTQVFFGRNQQIATLLIRISSQVTFGRAFCLILGPSGSGKSSLVNAGVLPRLLHHNGYDGIGVCAYTSLDFADVSHGRLFIDLASALLDWEYDERPVFTGLSADILAHKLQINSQEVITLCQQVLNKAISPFARPHFFLFIDRLEVLLSSPLFSDEERLLFLQIVETLAISGCIMVFSACRNDFYPLMIDQPSLMAGKSNGAHFDLMSPQRTELMQMIRLPAVAANLSWSKDLQSDRPLDEILCSEAAKNPDSLPMLQYTLQELYVQRSDNNELQFSVYQELGGIEGAIGKKAERVYQLLAACQQGQLAYVLSLLVTLSPDGETITSRAARWSRLNTPGQTKFVQAMVNNRLFVSHLQNDEAYFSLAHEALLRRWPRASKWIAAHRESLEIKSRLQRVTKSWINEGKNPSYLLTQGKPLQEAQSLKGSTEFTLDRDEHALIAASQQRGNRKRWLTRATISLLCVLTFTAVLMSIKSQQAEAFAQQKRLDAESLLGFMVGDFADKLRSVKRMDLLDGISNKALEYFTHQDNQQAGQSFFSLSDPYLNFQTRFQHAKTLGAIGEVAYSRAKNDEAKQAFASAKLILEKLYGEEADNLQLLKTLGANAFWLGQLAIDKATLNEAKVFFELYLKYSQAMIQLAPDDKDALWELSYAYLAIGSVNSKLQHVSDAKLAFEGALAIQYTITKSLPKDDIANSYTVNTLEWLAETQEQLGHLQQAVQTRQKGQAALSAFLRVHKDNGDLLESLAYSYFNNANIQYYMSDYIVANQSILSAMTHLNTLLGQDPSNQVWRSQLLSAEAFQLYLAKLNNSESSGSPINLADFKNLLNKAEKSSSSLAIIIKTYQISGRWNMAQRAINLAKPKMADLVSEKDKNSKLLSALANIYLSEAKQAVNYQISNKSNIKLNACQQAISILQPVITLNSSYELLLPYVQAKDCLGHISSIRDFVNKLEKMQIHNYQF
ncbi:MAG: DNA-binding winged helix-turn-helix (wHTH) protein [Paraglaciecola sp.]|jgi:DNA-binding winged helix-turn-helix (wHTH) protein/energy-coupling factor transporter ATP-binding protein EcfA2